MEQIITYFIKVNLTIFILYSLYWILIRNNRNFYLNRLFLLSTLLFAFVFPFISIPEKVETLVNINQFQFVGDVFDYADFSNTGSHVMDLPKTSFSMSMLLSSIYLLISSFILFRFIVELVRIIIKIFAYDKIKKDRFTLVVNHGFKSPFSFLHYIFVEKFPGVNSLVLEHEKVHARQWHTLDLFITQIFSALLWINPFMYLLKKELVAQHEFLADSGVLSNVENTDMYMNQIFEQAQSNFNNSLVSKFNYSLTKKRLKMMKNIDSKQKNIFKYFVLFIATGIIAGLFAFTNTEYVDVSEGKLIEVPVLMKSVDNEPSIWPVKKEKVEKITGYGMRMHPIYKKKKMHKGIDLKAKSGTEIMVTTDGVVRDADYKGGYGKRIIIDHDKEYSTLYAHLSEYKVKSGDKVKKGDIIGFVGQTGMSTAPHLHYEVMKAGKNVDPADYMN
ncbi:MAG: peptidoglycan DD-metalloendopeptidase family protein [Bacteroidota bacterium]